MVHNNSNKTDRNTFTLRVVQLLSSIPQGRVATYGQIAALAGNPSGARTVVWILRSSSAKYNLPWQRVINSKGIVSTGSMRHVELLEEEGVTVDNFRIDLEKYIWNPGAGFLKIISDIHNHPDD